MIYNLLTPLTPLDIIVGQPEYLVVQDKEATLLHVYHWDMPTSKELNWKSQKSLLTFTYIEEARDKYHWI